MTSPSAPAVADSDFPFTIRQLNASTHLIREKDRYQDFPHIYAKVVFASRGSTQAALIVLSDTGSGTNLLDNSRNLGTFLRATINPDGRLPYLVITSHCHYDHILGLNYLPPTDSGLTTVVASSHQKSFIIPRSHLAKNSLCNDIGVPPPKYDVGVWATDLQDLTYRCQTGPAVQAVGGESKWVELHTKLTLLHTPGHTPDSLTWYDREERYIAVGDSFNERESPDTRVGGEPPMPTMFDLESDLMDWWDSLKKVIAFVQARNEEEEEDEDENENEAEEGDDWVMVDSGHHPHRKGRKKKRVRLGAAHVTADVDAEECLLAMRNFMEKVLRDEIPSCSLGQERGEETYLWDEALGEGDGKGRFSVKAPLRIIEEGREAIPRHQIWGVGES